MKEVLKDMTNQEVDTFFRNKNWHCTYKDIYYVQNNCPQLRLIKYNGGDEYYIEMNNGDNWTLHCYAYE